MYFQYEVRHESGENIPVSLYISGDIRNTDISYETDGFEIVKRAETENGEDIILSFLPGVEEAHLAARIADGSETAAVLDLYGLMTEKGAFISYYEYNVWGAYFYSGVEDGEYTVWESSWLLAEHFHDEWDALQTPRTITDGITYLYINTYRK